MSTKKSGGKKIVTYVEKKIDGNLKRYFGGDTFPHKETIKNQGSRWDPAEKMWTVPDKFETKEEIEEFLLTLNGEPVKPPEEEYFSTKQSLSENDSKKVAENHKM